METLDRIMDMQRQGIPDTEISTTLQNEGVSPNQINDGLNQAKIKNAVSPAEQGAQPPTNQEMQPSIMETAGQNQPIRPPAEQGAQPPVGTQPQIGQENPAAPGPEIYPPQGQEQEYYPETPQAYSEQDYYAPQGNLDTETISEIAEQVATEKINEFKKKTGDLVSFKNNIQDQVNNIDDRLKRIESSIDKLQQAVIGKIGEFGESNAMIHKDLDNLHGTVSKLMNPLIDNVNALKKIAR